MTLKHSDQDPGDEQPRHPTERERVETFVQERFRELGFNEHQAVALADNGVDWHQARTLIESGCSIEHAILILT